ncbi:hypothetical protein [Desulfuromonas versatilis]|uniref:hypothetical protein n=1 Tax=Desulfuromonas versatilis TaxID=2802975 RepID=UPI001C847AB3|nr:hypothetical protein [Desulfuromonas versatilis]
MLGGFLYHGLSLLAHLAGHFFGLLQGFPGRLGGRFSRLIRCFHSFLGHLFGRFFYLLGHLLHFFHGFFSLRGLFRGFRFRCLGLLFLFAATEGKHRGQKNYCYLKFFHDSSFSLFPISSGAWEIFPLQLCATWLEDFKEGFREFKSAGDFMPLEGKKFVSTAA